MEPVIYDEFESIVRIRIRSATLEDLPALEWWGWHSEHRDIIHRVYEEMLRGESLILVAEAGGFPIGQAWIDFEKRAADRAGLLWAVRIIPGFRNLGIGTRLMRIAERIMLERGLPVSELAVEKDNPDAKRLYERVGYRVFTEERDQQLFHEGDGTSGVIETDQWILRKDLRKAA